MSEREAYRLVIRRLRAGRRIIIRDFACDLPATGIVCVVGPNGAGKSLLLRALTNIDRGQRVSLERADGTTPEVAVAFDFAGLLPSKDLSYLFDAASWFDCTEDALTANLERLGVDLDNRLSFARWSLGTRQRARIAVALSSERPVVILDEPFRSIDDQHRFALIELLVEKSRSQLVIVSTHHAELLSGFAHSTLALARGSQPLTLLVRDETTPQAHRLQITGRGLSNLAGAKSIDNADGVVHQSAIVDRRGLEQLWSELDSPDVEIYSVVVSDDDVAT